VLAFLGALRLAQDYVVFPRLVRRGIHMHPLGVILAILSGAELAGLVGIFLAIPAVAVLSVMHRHVLEYRGSAGLVSELLNHAQSVTDAARATSDPQATPISFPPADTPGTGATSNGGHAMSLGSRGRTAHRANLRHRSQGLVG
jgi:hypothetical protein